MNVTALHLERNKNNQHKYLGNIIIGKYLGVVVGNEKSFHCEESNHCPRGIKRDLPCDKKGVMGAALCSPGKAGAQHIFLRLTF